MEFSILNLLLVLLAAWLAGNAVSRFGYPSIFGELAAGIILGPPLLGLLQSGEALLVLAEVGVLLMMLYVGMEIDPDEILEASWAGALASIGGFITPFVLAYFAVIWLGGTVGAGLFVGIAAGITSLTTKSRILVDLGLLNTRIAHVLMAGALIADSLSLITFAAIIGVFDAGGVNIGELGLVAGKAALFFVATFLVGAKVFPVLWASLKRRGLTSRTFNATLILLIALLFAELAELAGLHAILGAFVAGLFLRESILERPLSQEMNKLVHDISIGFLAPVFFVTAGFQVSLSVFQTDLPLLLVVIVAATLGKIAGTTLFYLPTGYGWREGFVVGMGMNGRGAVEIIIAEIALQMGIISQEIFSILVFMAIFTTAMVPLMLKWGTDWLRTRGELVDARQQRSGTIIVGAGPVARRLAKVLSPAQTVWLIDSNREHCRIAREEGLNVVCGDALEEEVLKEANAVQSRWFLALTANTEINVLSAQLARNAFGIPDVYVRVGRRQGHSLYNVLDTLEVITLDEEQDELLHWDHWLTRDPIEEITLTISESTKASDLLNQLRHKEKRALPLAILQNGQRKPFLVSDQLEPGDRVLALSRS